MKGHQATRQSVNCNPVPASSLFILPFPVILLLIFSSLLLFCVVFPLAFGFATAIALFLVLAGPVV
jgi:hypothetical protein